MLPFYIIFHWENIWSKDVFSKYSSPLVSTGIDSRTAHSTQIHVYSRSLYYIGIIFSHNLFRFSHVQLFVTPWTVDSASVQLETKAQPYYLFCILLMCLTQSSHSRCSKYALNIWNVKNCDWFLLHEPNSCDRTIVSTWQAADSRPDEHSQHPVCFWKMELGRIALSTQQTTWT